jgi:hypothetical protein
MQFRLFFILSKGCLLEKALLTITGRGIPHDYAGKGKPRSGYRAGLSFRGGEPQFDWPSLTSSNKKKLTFYPLDGYTPIDFLRRCLGTTRCDSLPVLNVQPVAFERG